jgi:hypothetical protein
MGERDRLSGTHQAAWQEPGGSLARGSLTLEPEAIMLHGTSSEGRHVVRRLAYADLAGVRIGRDPQERLSGNPTLLLERRTGGLLKVSLLGPGLLWELADLLALVVGESGEHLERVVVVARLKEGMRERLRELIAGGPPFDPHASGLHRHEVLLADDTVIFLLEGREISEVVQKLALQPRLWKAALAWEACLTGSPQLATVAYSWTREGTAGDV